MNTILRLIAVVMISTVSAHGKSGGGNSVSDEPETLRVLVWNLWHGGNEVTNGPEKALKLF